MEKRVTVEKVEAQIYFFINNIYFNICSKGTKGPSRELMLFTRHVKKIRLHVTIEKKRNEKTKTHMQRIRSWQKRLDQEIKDWTY